MKYYENFRFHSTHLHKIFYTLPFDDVSASEWYAPFVAIAKELGILEETGSNYEPGNSMTRGGMCEVLWRLVSG